MSCDDLMSGANLLSLRQDTAHIFDTWTYINISLSFLFFFILEDLKVETVVEKRRTSNPNCRLILNGFIYLFLVYRNINLFSYLKIYI